MTNQNLAPSQPIIEDVDQSTKAYLKQNDKLYIVLYAIFVIATFAAIMFWQLDAHLFIIPIIIGSVAYAHVQSRIKRQFTEQFGSSIGFMYSPSAEMSSVNGKLFGIGRSQRIYDVLAGTMSGRQARIFTYTFTVGSGKHSTTYNFTVFEITFANVMPDVVLNSKVDVCNMLGIDSGENIKLEGDFNQYFSLYVPKGYELEAYQIFTPDVMAVLIDRARDLNFEFVGNKLYIYDDKSVTNRAKLQNMFALADYLDDLFSKNVQRIDVTALQALQNK